MIDQAIALPTLRPVSLSEHRRLRFATLFLLYVAQGLPFGLIDFALPAWLAQNGASAAAIGGVLAMIILPWTFKLAYGFVMDRYAFLAMGRRRPWIIVGQAGLFSGLLAMALVNPGAHQLGLIAAFAFILGMTSAVQDVAVDGLAVDILPAEEIERVNGFMFGGQAIGIAMGAAISGTLIAYHGLPAAALALATLIGAILLLVLVVRERPGERLLPWTSGTASQRNLDLQLAAFAPIIRNLLTAMFTRRTLLLIPAFIAASAAWGIFLGVAPLYTANTLGWDRDTYSGWSGQANLAAGLAGGLLFGFMAERWGARRMFVLTALATATLSLVMFVLTGGPLGPMLFIAAIFGFTALNVLRCVTAGALSMQLCSPAIARHSVRGLHGHPQRRSGGRGCLAGWARPAWRSSRHVRRHDRAWPCLCRLRVRGKSGPLTGRSDSPDAQAADDAGRRLRARGECPRYLRHDRTAWTRDGTALDYDCS